MIHQTQQSVLNMSTSAEIESLLNPKAPKCSRSFFTEAIFFQKYFVLWILARTPIISLKCRYLSTLLLVLLRKQLFWHNVSVARLHGVHSSPISVSFNTLPL